MILKEPGKISRSSLKRLPLYLHLLEGLLKEGAEHVSCTRIAAEFDLDPTQVRKDLAATGEEGTARIGFRIFTLVEHIRDILGWTRPHDAFLVGAGNLGKALLGYRDFERYGLNIVAVFDADPRKVGGKIFGKEVLPLVALPRMAARSSARIGIVCVPAEHTQSVVDLMVGCGLRAIWNFAPAPLHIPPGVILENARLTQSLAVLTSQLTHPSAKAKTSFRRGKKI